MYDLPHHKESDQEEIIRFMKDHPFVFLTGSDTANRPVVTQVPVFIDERDGKYFLTGHIMRDTDHHKAFEQNKKAHRLARTARAIRQSLLRKAQDTNLFFLHWILPDTRVFLSWINSAKGKSWHCRSRPADL